MRPHRPGPQCWALRTQFGTKPTWPANNTSIRKGDIIICWWPSANGRGGTIFAIADVLSTPRGGPHWQERCVPGLPLSSDDPRGAGLMHRVTGIGRPVAPLPVSIVAEIVRAAQAPALDTMGAPGRQPDLDERLVVEQYAMDRASAHFEAHGWNVDNVATRFCYDLTCRRGGVELHVEVKGTTTAGAAVELTRNEVEHARTYPYVALFIVTDVVVRQIAQGKPVASGGRDILHHPWRIDDGTLWPSRYDYYPPATKGSSSVPPLAAVKRSRVRNSIGLPRPRVSPRKGTLAASGRRTKAKASA